MKVDKVINKSNNSITTKVDIWTDGSYNRHNEKCAWAFVVKVNGVFVHEDSGEIFDDHRSTNVAEMTAIIKALEFVDECTKGIKENTTLQVYSDSQYCVKGIEEWIHAWRVKRYQGKKNVALWKHMYDLVYNTKYIYVGFEWVRGHTGIEENERCDYLAGLYTKKEYVGY